MEIDFTGKTALVTGAGKGIGRATVKLLAKCGANIVALSRTKSDLNSLQNEVPTKFIPVVADLMKLDEAVKAVEVTGEHIDLLVNNAGLVVMKETIDVTEEDIDRSIIINVKAPVRLSQLVSSDLIKRGTSGAIVNISTIVSKSASAGRMPYSMTKAAMNNATAAMAVELAKYKIRVNSIFPGITATAAVVEYAESEPVQSTLARTPRGQMADPGEIAHTIVYLLSDFASNITGAMVASDGGFLAN